MVLNIIVFKVYELNLKLYFIYFIFFLHNLIVESLE